MEQSTHFALDAVRPVDTRFAWLPPYRGVRVGQADNPGPRDRAIARINNVDLRDRPSVGKVKIVHRARLIAELRAFATDRGDDLAALFTEGVEAVISLLRDFG